MVGWILKKILGSKNQREIKRLTPTVRRINEFDEQFKALSDDELRAKTATWKAELAAIPELRDQWAAARQSGFSPLAGLQDGTGAAKIDLQPGSAFLTDLNARPWPPAVPVRIIGGVLMTSTPALGDGVVAPESLVLEGAPPPVMVTASHRGMLARLFQSDEEPPAIPVIMGLLEEWENSE